MCHQRVPGKLRVFHLFQELARPNANKHTHFSNFYFCNGLVHHYYVFTTGKALWPIFKKEIGTWTPYVLCSFFEGWGLVICASHTLFFKSVSTKTSQSLPASKRWGIWWQWTSLAWGDMVMEPRAAVPMFIRILFSWSPSSAGLWPMSLF